MTRRRLNIILSVFSIIFAFSLFGFGVYASTSINSTINNTFKYEVPAEDFYVEITGSIIGCKDEQDFNQFLTHKKDSTTTTYTNYFDVEFVEIGSEVYKDIIFSFKVSNYNAFPITAQIVTETQSNNFTSTVSQPITLDAYQKQQPDGNYIADEDILTLTLAMTTNKTFIKNPNSFKIVFALA